jgi:predicted XRE-type DNA-binding protein
MVKPASENQPRPVRWVGSSKKDLSDFPDEVRRRVGGALWEAQIGRKAVYAKPVKGFGDAGVLEPTAQASERGLRAMVKERETHIPVTESSGNVFADMGLPEAEEELTKAQLASHIRQVIKRQRLTQIAAAAVMGIDQPKVSALLNGRLTNFSSERLMRLLTALGQDVDITVRAKPRNRAHGRIRVLGEAHA